ncbi:MAG TPA: MoxR family ATPase [Bryobacteraceae bacterium]|jgi:MoxR-like ATPase|nr:MoxR family ATPase [Bryobacteraceae bacterium]
MADTLVAETVSVERAMRDLNRVREEIGKIIVGQTDVIDGVLICLIAGGHVLLEGVPGLGKTTLLRTLSRVLDLRYSRVQFTPDLMPGDIVGSVVMESDEHGHKNLRFQPGPIFSNLVLADEINRATPKTQSALLEAMQERTVTSGNSTYSLEPPFLVMATQNPIEMEGTYPLPEAQLDRFLMKILVTYPSREDLSRIVDVTTRSDQMEVRKVMDRDQIADIKAISRQIIVAPHVQEYAISLVMATQPATPEAPEITNRYIRYGSSPRGAQALIECGRVLALLKGRLHLSINDVLAVAPGVLRHRIILNFDAHADGESTETILQKIFAIIENHANLKP